MNKINILFIFSFVLLSISCTRQQPNQRIITVTIEPQRYFLEQLVDTLYEIQTMVPPGMSPETYDPSPVQMTKLSDSQAYFQIGKIGFELIWMDKIRKNNPGLQVFDNSKNIHFLVSEEEDSHSHSHEGHCHSHEGYDPHIWSSPKQVRMIIRNMYDALVDLDNPNVEIYKQNLQELEHMVEKTDSIVTHYLQQSGNKTFVIYHPALTYLANDYGLTQLCIETEGKEPSPEQLRHLIEKIKENQIQTVFIQQEFDQKNAEIIAKETGCHLHVINPLAYNWNEEMIRIAKAFSNE